MISEEGLQKFIDLYELKYSIRLDRQEAFNVFSKLISMVKLVNTSETLNNE
jgi:hypothetical protein